MPMIKIEFDDAKVSDEEAKVLSEVIQKIVSEITSIDDVFVYANTAKIKVKVAPIEIFVEMSEHKVENLDELTSKIKDKLTSWKAQNGYKIPINLTIIPMRWKVEVEI